MQTMDTRALISGLAVSTAVLGLWLFLSAFLWPHSRFQLFNAWIVGMAAVTIATLSISNRARSGYGASALGAWLIITSLFLARAGSATFWNHILVGFCLALVGAGQTASTGIDQRLHARP